MPDGTLEAIDRFFDLIDHGVDHVDRVLNRGKFTAARLSAHKGDRSGITTPVRKPSKAPVAATTKALTTRPRARKSRFYIVEAVTSSGITEFVVTDGGNARTICPSRAAAEQLLRALEKVP